MGNAVGDSRTRLIVTHPPEEHPGPLSGMVTNVCPELHKMLLLPNPVLQINTSPLNSGDAVQCLTQDKQRNKSETFILKILNLNRN